MCAIRVIVILAAVASLCGCAGMGGRPYVFEPQERDALVPYYVVGQPYASASSDCGQVTVSLAPSILGGGSYMRAFVHYENTVSYTHLRAHET